MMDKRARAKILCVDDEPNILEALALNLGRRYDVVTATSGAAGLEALRREAATAVVISDMRMPGMDGAAFLHQARHVVPDAVRILLTGYTDLDSAIAAVNQGQIFRFLTKPCPPVALIIAVEAAAEQHRLLTAERVLLEQTLHGSIGALTDVLALTNPVSFGRAIRIKQLVSELVAVLDMPERWQVEVAAMLSQLGCMTLPAETLEKLYYGRPMSGEEEEMVGRLPSVTEQLLGHIPRLEVVRGILATYTRPYRRSDAGADPQKALIHRGAQLLKIASDFDVLEAQGHTRSHALDIMRGRTDWYDAAVLDGLDAIRGIGRAREEIREMSLAALEVGMVFDEDVKLETGALLVARGYVVTERFIERARNFRPGTIKDRLRVIIRNAAKEVTPRPVNTPRSE